MRHAVKQKTEEEEQKYKGDFFGHASHHEARIQFISCIMKDLRSVPRVVKKVSPFDHDCFLLSLKLQSEHIGCFLVKRNNACCKNKATNEWLEPEKSMFCKDGPFCLG